jgi:hypothetical protein
MTLTIFPGLPEASHMKNWSYHSHHASDHETGRCRCAGWAWKLPLEIWLQNWAVWEHENPMNMILAANLDGFPGPWFVSGGLGFFSSSFFLPVLFSWLVHFSNSSYLVQVRSLRSLHAMQIIIEDSVNDCRLGISCPCRCASSEGGFVSCQHPDKLSIIYLSIGL